MLHVYSYTPTMRSGRLLASLKVASMSSSRTIALTPAFQTLFSSGCAIPRSSVNANAQRSFVTMNGDGDHSDNLDLIFEQKHSLRSKIRRALKSMDPIQRSHEDNMIQDIVLQAPWFRSSDSVCAYITCDALREVSTSRILSAFLTDPSNDYKRLYVPRVEDKNSNMRMLKITNVNDLVASSMNILEPEPVDHNGNLREDVMQATEPVDLFILPGLAFDRSGRRLGRSGGYYDLFLRNYRQRAEEKRWKQPLLVALCYSVQLMDEGSIPVTPFDISVDALVSPAGFIPISPSAVKWSRREVST